MEITVVSTSGLMDIKNLVVKNKLKLCMSELRELLKFTNIFFILEGINRVQSTLICECKDSYVQQSQRYVQMNSNAYTKMEGLDEKDINKAHSLIEKCFTLYSKMSETKEGCKGRPKIEDFKYAINFEDARYILPLATKTNISISLTGDKLIDMLFYLAEYKYINDELINLIINKLSLNYFGITIDSFKKEQTYNSKLLESYKFNLFNTIENTGECVLLNSHMFANENVGLAAITSTEQSPTESYIDKYNNSQDELVGVIERVLGYGHKGIAEHCRNSFLLSCSLSSYHQQIRHRIPTIIREDLFDIIVLNNREVYIPESIKNSIFIDEYIDLISRIKKFRLELLSRKGRYTLVLPLLLNCDMVKYFISNNARADVEMLKDRLCMTAQTEIRENSTKKVIQLKKISKVLFEEAEPPCVKGKCKEGDLTCGKTKEVKEKFTNLY